MKSNGFYTYIKEDLMADIPGVTSRAMFGGYGFYKDGKIFGMIIEDKLFFKVGEGNKKDYQEKGSGPFTYKSKTGKEVVMPYWEVPEEVMEDRQTFREWIEKAAQGNL